MRACVYAQVNIKQYRLLGFCEICWPVVGYYFYLFQACNYSLAGVAQKYRETVPANDLSSFRKISTFLMQKERTVCRDTVAVSNLEHIQSDQLVSLKREQHVSG